MRLYIKNMVCNRCVAAVRQELEKLNLQSSNIALGEVETNDIVSQDQLKKLGNNLAALGFELLDDSKQQLIEKIKT
jgi:copper chaperone CopZ